MRHSCVSTYSHFRNVQACTFSLIAKLSGDFPKTVRNKTAKIIKMFTVAAAVSDPRYDIRTIFGLRILSRSNGDLLSGFKIPEHPYDCCRSNIKSDTKTRAAFISCKPRRVFQHFHFVVIDFAKLSKAFASAAFTADTGTLKHCSCSFLICPYFRILSLVTCIPSQRKDLLQLQALPRTRDGSR